MKGGRQGSAGNGRASRCGKKNDDRIFQREIAIFCYAFKLMNGEVKNETVGKEPTERQDCGH